MTTPVPNAGHNLTLHPENIGEFLTATLTPEENLLTLDANGDITLAQWVGVEDEEDARGRLAALFGAAFASAITIATEE